MPRLVVPLVAVMLALAVSIPLRDVARADAPPTEPEAVARLFTAPQVDPAWFSPELLAQVPVERMQSLIDRVRGALGEYRSVTASGSAYQVRFANGSMRVTISLGSKGEIAGLLFGSPVSNDPVQARQQAVAQLKLLPGQVSYLVTRNGTDLEAQSPDDRLAVGSAFKLAVLAALEDQVASGKHRWDEVVTLQEQWRSLPSGILQDWPAGTPVTIQTLANLMISRSDNTAADTLLHIVGREAAEKYGPANTPFLSTRELFTLKRPHLSDLLARYRAASVPQKRAMLTEIDAQPFEPGDIDITPDANDIEWFFSARELCGLLDKTADDKAFGINPGLADKTQWRSIAFKGGSEPGVINLSQRVVAQDGTAYCIIVTWNDASADAETLTGFIAPLIGSLSGKP